MSATLLNCTFGLDRNNFTFAQYYQEMKTTIKLTLIALAVTVLISCAHRKHSCAAYNQTAVSEIAVD